MSTSKSYTPVASLEPHSLRKRKFLDKGLGQRLTPSTPSRCESHKDILSRRNLSIAATSPDFCVFSTQNRGGLYKRRKIQTKIGKILSSPASCDGTFVSDLRSPVSLARKGFTVSECPRKNVVRTPLNLIRSRADLYDDGSMEKFLKFRKACRERLPGSSEKESSVADNNDLSKRDYLVPLVPSQAITSSKSRLAGLRTPVGRELISRATSGRSLFRTPDVTPLCKQIINCVNISTPLNKSHLQGTPVIERKPEESKPGTPNPVESAIKKSLENPNLIGDFSQACLLPTIKGKNPDIPSISPATMVNVLNGEYDESFMILDCRYPYEFEGGHIKGAKNFYTKKEMAKKLFPRKVNLNTGPRPILIFHCEFSSERGPNMYRFVRKKDRQRNAANYPSLFYPEMYVLDGGYCAFYSNHKEYCEPQEYKPMRDKQNTQDLHHCRAECKADEKSNSANNVYDDGAVEKLEF